MSSREKESLTDRRERIKNELTEYNKAANILQDLPFGEINSWEELLAYQVMSTFSYIFSIKSKDNNCIYGIPNEQKHLYLEQSQKYAKAVTDFFFYQREYKPEWYKKGLKTASKETLNKVWNHFKQAFDIRARMYDLDCYAVAIEWNRPLDEQFFLPRRKCFMNLETIDGELVNLVQDGQDLIDGKLDFLFNALPQRCGKAQSLTSKILTPNGFIIMGEIKVGDLVATQDGTFTKVIGVFPQGEKDIYRVEFTDGTSTECCKEHLWTCQTREDKRIGRGYNEPRYRTIELKEIMKNYRLNNGGGKTASNYTIDYCQPIQFDKKELKINPYVLGVLLGDGSFCKGNITLSNSEPDIIEKVSNLISSDDKLSPVSNREYVISRNIRNNDISETKKALQFYNLCNKHSYNKFIPKDYLFSCVEDRLELLRGLIDTDGYCSKNEIEYTTSSKLLKDDIIFLVQSLGGKISCVERESHYTKNGIRTKCKNSYRMQIYFPKNVCPVSSRKHLSKLSIKRDTFKKGIGNIVYIGKKECQCIMVEHPSHLYVTDDFIVTHNSQLRLTVLSLMAIKEVRRGGNKSVFTLSHSAGLARHFYNSTLRIFNDTRTYRTLEVFPEISIFFKSNEYREVTLNREQTYPTFADKSIDGDVTGSTEASLCASADDLIKDHSEVLNPEVANKILDKANTYIFGRKKKGVPVYGNATLWGELCPFTRIIEAYNGIRSDRIKINLFSCFNSKGESQFDYECNLGFDTAHFKEIERRMSITNYALWSALYLSRPLPVEGRLFDNVLFFRQSELVELKSKRKLYVCCPVDVAIKKKGDYLAAPIMEVDEVEKVIYISDMIYSNHGTDYTIPKLAEMFMQYRVERAEFEEKEGADKGNKIDFGIKSEVKKMTASLGYTNCVMNNHTGAGLNSKGNRIDSRATEIAGIRVPNKYIMKFLHPEDRLTHKEYNLGMTHLFAYSQSPKKQGKQKDDLPDALSMGCDYLILDLTNDVEIYSIKKLLPF